MNVEAGERDVEKIQAIIEERNRRYSARGGSVRLAGIEDATIKIEPAGFCWR